jgi:hypothetical protein
MNSVEFISCFIFHILVNRRKTLNNSNVSNDYYDTYETNI